MCKSTRKERITLSDCNHTMCLDCFANQVYKIQWFHGFTLDRPIFCPHCQHEVSRNDWYEVMRHLYKLKKVEVYIQWEKDKYFIIYGHYIEERYEPDTSHRIQIREHIEYIE